MPEKRRGKKRTMGQAGRTAVIILLNHVAVITGIEGNLFIYGEKLLCSIKGRIALKKGGP